MNNTGPYYAKVSDKVWAGPGGPLQAAPGPSRPLQAASQAAENGGASSAAHQLIVPDRSFSFS